MFYVIEINLYFTQVIFINFTILIILFYIYENDNKFYGLFRFYITFRIYFAGFTINVCKFESILFICSIRVNRFSKVRDVQIDS